MVEREKAVSQSVRLAVQRQMDELVRGAAEVITEDELEEKLTESVLEGRPLRVKEGTDPSRPDIHLGHAVTYRKLRQFQDFGHEVTFLIGDFTGMIGDPTGKNAARRALSREEVNRNAETFARQFYKILDPDRTRLRYNSEWLAKLSAEQLVQLASKYTVARMLERDDFARRFAENRPISIHEFFYPLFQGYDSVALHADVEVGGLDQKFNFIVGRELQREYGQKPEVALMMPLLVGLDGVQKMSKSLDNYVGIEEPPAEMYGKIMSIPDAVMSDYYELATGVPIAQVREIIAGLRAGELHPRDVKRRLAREIVRMYHDERAAGQAEEAFDLVFKDHGIPEDVPEFRLGADLLADDGEGVWVVRLLTATGLAASSGEARRLVAQGGVRINGQPVTGVDTMIVPAPGDVIQAGKRRFARLVLGDKR